MSRLTTWRWLGREPQAASLVGRAFRARREDTSHSTSTSLGYLRRRELGVRALPSKAAVLVLLACAQSHGPLAVATEKPLLGFGLCRSGDVSIQDSFWAPRRETNRVASIPFSLQKLEEAGNLEDMRLAARGATKGFQGPVFFDSDLYKALEAASYSLATHPDPALEKQLDDIIACWPPPSSPTATSTAITRSRNPANAGPTCATVTSSIAPATCSKPPPRTTRLPARKPS